MSSPIDLIDHPFSPKIYHRGPPLANGPLPSVFYFSLSGEESLGLPPYNQPAVLLSEHGIRVFSLTLPSHEGQFPHTHAIKEWADSFLSEKNMIGEFVETCLKALDFLIKKGYIDIQHIATAGLSRGAFIATHLAAHDERIKTILGFAPLTRLETMKDFKDILDLPIIPTLSLESLIPKLIHKRLLFHIGNGDTLVSTPYCFSFIHALAESIYQKKHQFAPVELIVYPSIGHKGHGTPPEIFHAGTSWLIKQLT